MSTYINGEQQFNDTPEQENRLKSAALAHPRAFIAEMQRIHDANVANGVYKKHMHNTDDTRMTQEERWEFNDPSADFGAILRRQMVALGINVAYVRTKEFRVPSGYGYSVTVEWAKDATNDDVDEMEDALISELKGFTHIDLRGGHDFPGNDRELYKDDVPYTSVWILRTIDY